MKRSILFFLIINFIILISCNENANEAKDVHELARVVAHAYENLDQATIEKFSAPMYRDQVEGQIRYRERMGLNGRDFRIINDTLIEMNNIHYFHVSYSDGKDGVLAFTQYTDTGDWFIYPQIGLGHPFQKPRGK